VSRRGSAEGPAGLVVVDKGPDWTSHDVVAKLRGIFGQRRTGHAGTLDPSATGVVLVGLGRATRLLRFLQDTTKRYEGVLVLGSTTTTLDADGEITGTFDMTGISLAEAVEVAKGLTGDILQVPPMVSALKVDGVRLHELARQGIEVDRQARPVTVGRFDLSATDDPLRLSFEVECSSGTYVRSLIDDLGRSLGGGAHMATLRRTCVGAFDLTEARSLEQIAELTDREHAIDSPALLTPADAMRGLPRVFADEEAIQRIRTGRWLEDPDPSQPAGPVAVLDRDEVLLGVYDRDGEGRLNAAVVLAAT
jgi:tRNA pseudouridine55 synthase